MIPKTNIERLQFAIKQNKRLKLWNDSGIPKFVSIGDNCKIHKSVIFEPQGFGYEWDSKKWLHINHTGKIVIEKDVDLHANVVVVRGTADDGITSIGHGTKIDSFCHIAHNVKIGNNCILGAMCGLSGSCEIGNNVRMGANVRILKGVKVGNDCDIMDHSVVRHNLKDGEIYGHNFKKL